MSKVKGIFDVIYVTDDDDAATVYEREAELRSFFADLIKDRLAYSWCAGCGAHHAPYQHDDGDGVVYHLCEDCEAV